MNDRYISKSRPSYRPLIQRRDSELAEAFDDWVYKQPEEVRASALCHVENVKYLVDGIGDTGAKALVFTTYAEVLAMASDTHPKSG